MNTSNKKNTAQISVFLASRWMQSLEALNEKLLNISLNFAKNIPGFEIEELQSSNQATEKIPAKKKAKEDANIETSPRFKNYVEATLKPLCEAEEISEEEAMKKLKSDWLDMTEDERNDFLNFTPPTQTE